MTARALGIVFEKGPTRRYRSVLTRADGVEVELEGGSWNAVGGPAREVPHDLAHLVVEEELGLARGVWGVLAAGGLFRGARVVGGRQKAHAAARAREVLAASVEELNRAEVLTRMVADLALADRVDVGAARAAAGERWWSETVTRETLARSFTRLRAEGEAWAALAPGDTLARTYTPLR
ncbi:MAG TPA: hypothetical protein VN238_23005 [Solirubrobacteraceae bacterium]|nr:hypothetical protein [Solirubrobacteraceae bacterium]